MKTVFADTYYFIAQLNPADEAHQRALAFTKTFDGMFVTTEWVLAEVGDAFCRGVNRQNFVRLYMQLAGMADFAIVPATFNDGMELFSARPDKDWSVTDCISFAVMKRIGISEALTGDHHFEQAGFVVLLTP